MGYEVHLSPQAYRDLEEAAEFIAQDSPGRAGKWLKRVLASIESLENLNVRHRPAPEAVLFEQDLRQLLFGRKRGIYRIIYRVDEEDAIVRVVAVRHGARLPLEPGINHLE